jgi:hypothetical protein
VSEPSNLLSEAVLVRANDDRAPERNWHTECGNENGDMTAFCFTHGGAPATVAAALDHAGSRESLCAPLFKGKVPPALVECARAATVFIAYRLPEVIPDNEAVKKYR